MIRIKAHYDGKVIVPDDPLELAPGTALDVTAEVRESGEGEPLNVWQRIAKLAEGMPGDLPADYAERHDDYKRKRLGLE